jgi:hypothetical protein
VQKDRAEGRARSKGQWKTLGVVVLVVAAAVGLTWLYYKRKAGMPGRAMDARIEGKVLVLVDEVCTQPSDRNAPPECDKRLTTVSLPDGKTLDVSFEGGVNPYRRLFCPDRIELDGGAYLTIASGGGEHIQLRRFAADRTEQWSAGLRGRCQLAQIVQDSLVIATEEPRLRAAAFDLASGARRWTVAP